MDDERHASEDTLTINLGSEEAAQSLFSEKKAGDRINIKKASGRLISLEEGRLTLQVDEIEFDKGRSAPTGTGEETIHPPDPDDSDSDAAVLVLLGTPGDEERTRQGRKENNNTKSLKIT